MIGVYKVKNYQFLENLSIRIPVESWRKYISLFNIPHGFLCRLQKEFGKVLLNIKEFTTVFFQIYFIISIVPFHLVFLLFNINVEFSQKRRCLNWLY